MHTLNDALDRSLERDGLLRLQRRVEELSQAVASGFGCNATVNWRLDVQPMYPPTVNDKATVDFTNKVAIK